MEREHVTSGEFLGVLTKFWEILNDEKLELPKPATRRFGIDSVEVKLEIEGRFMSSEGSSTCEFVCRTPTVQMKLSGQGRKRNLFLVLMSQDSNIHFPLIKARQLLLHDSHVEIELKEAKAELHFF